MKDGSMAPALLALVFLVATLPPASSAPSAPPTVVRAVAVAETANGLVGSVANVSISQENGTGLLFIDTQPFTEVDMQGSARLAVRVAGAITGFDVSKRDFFFVIRSDSQIIGGPSAGGVLTVGAIAALEGWAIDPHVYMTGTVNPDGSVGPVAGIPEKAAAAARMGATLFLFPAGEEITQGVAQTGPFTVNLTKYCADQFHITCEPVADVEGAVTAFTGHVFEHPQLAGNDTGARFAGVMLPLAKRELERANASLARARTRFDGASDLPSSMRTDVRSRIDEATTTLANGTASFQAGHYYTGASKAFVTSIDARYALSAIAYASASDPTAYVNARLDEAQTAIDNATARAKTASVTGLSQLEAVGAAQARITEAEQSLTDAKTAARQGLTANALYGAAFTVERASTVGWWLDIGDAFAGGKKMSDAEIAREARDAIDESSQVVTYVQQTLTSAGLDGSQVQDQLTQLEAARADLARGFGAAALFESLEAQVRAGLVLQTATGVAIPPARIASAEIEAQRAIDSARASGIEPVAAASDFEFASDQTDALGKLTFYDLAAIIARSGDFYTRGTGDQPVASRYIGTVAPAPAETPPSLTPAQAVSFTVLPFVLGALGATLLVLAFRRAPPLPPPEAPSRPAGPTGETFTVYEAPPPEPPGEPPASPPPPQ